MPAYIVALVDVKDPERYKEYGEAWNYGSFMGDYAGEFVVINDPEEAEVIEGDWSSRLIIMKFPDAEKARAWYDSPEYHDVRKIRWAHSTTNMALFPGFDLQAALAEMSPEE
jgi:uncharacterized protein (DUF1330 family)